MNILDIPNHVIIDNLIPYIKDSRTLCSLSLSCKLFSEYTRLGVIEILFLDKGSDEFFQDRLRRLLSMPKLKRIYGVSMIVQKDHFPYRTQPQELEDNALLKLIYKLDQLSIKVEGDIIRHIFKVNNDISVNDELPNNLFVTLFENIYYNMIMKLRDIKRELSTRKDYHLDIDFQFGVCRSRIKMSITNGIFVIGPMSQIIESWSTKVILAFLITQTSFQDYGLKFHLFNPISGIEQFCIKERLVEYDDELFRLVIGAEFGLENPTIPPSDTNIALSSKIFLTKALLHPIDLEILVVAQYLNTVASGKEASILECFRGSFTTSSFTYKKYQEAQHNAKYLREVYIPTIGGILEYSDSGTCIKLIMPSGSRTYYDSSGREFQYDWNGFFTKVNAI